MKLRLIGLALVFMLLTGGVAWSGKEAYILVVSKNKDMCKSLLDLFNKDIKEHGELTYQHDAFTRVQWHPIGSIYDKRYPADQCESLKQATFDINNDGHSNLVLKYSGCLHDQLSDGLFVFPEDSDILSRLKPGPGGLSDMFATANKFERTGDLYELKAMPEKKGESVPSLGPVFVLQPFAWEHTFYVSMTGLRRDWVVVAKYRQAESIQDVCYFKRRL